MRAGFTLVETALATVIVGVGVIAVLQLLAAGTRTTGDSLRLTSGLNVAHGFREFSLTRSISALDALNGRQLSPPIDARGNPISGLSDWKQAITVQGADLQRVTLGVPAASSPLRRVTVTVSHKNQSVVSMDWLVAP
jgi:Tfp pilus assembly protein PilV